MKSLILATAAVFGLTAPAFAFDCAKASSDVEHQICGSKALRRADEDMSAAYTKLLRTLDDPEIHAALIESQRRWIKARDSGINDPATLEGSGTDDDSTPPSWADVLTRVTRERTSFLKKTAGGKPAFVAGALAQRKALGPSGKGPWAGFSSSCYFIPDRQHPNDYTYNCFGSMSRQNGDRVCSESTDFASYTSQTTRIVADIVDGRAQARAKCGFGNDVKTCPDETVDKAAADGGWDMNAGKDDAPGKPELKLDPEASETVADAGWMDACLADKSFPAGASGH
ncbi:lysozyme inhibitor LprI family protein [Mesorhizobium sp. B2-3-4]|uniref:lysozyme inhibitor LprI family protein n=1 Tax=Mesorhizobium sp. B2-3-4 TaxID=2589959 RepID=UPI0011268D75|nr:lysozyme inhibitor LprI family protein [Mesorhizobium sp. B2-3-4]TPM38607.1 DUF1311 domain-containing protein [Mesorhizobium sp. B2-3-4]